jgi:hypothetical protein
VDLPGLQHECIGQLQNAPRASQTREPVGFQELAQYVFVSGVSKIPGSPCPFLHPTSLSKELVTQVTCHF